MAGQAQTVPQPARTIRNANQLRITLSSPYAFQTHWAEVNADEKKEILDSLGKFFGELPSLAAERKRRKQKKQTPGCSQQHVTEDQEKDKVVIKALKSVVIIGINQVTKGLEKGQLEAVVLNQPNAHEAVLSEHLKVLSGTRNTPVCVLPGFSERMRKLFSMKHVVAMGFKKCNNRPDHLPAKLYDSIRQISQKIQNVTPVIALPWLHTEEQLFEKVEQYKQLFPSADKKFVSSREPVIAKGEKRKAEETSDVLKRAKVDLEDPFATEETKPSVSKESVKPVIQNIKYHTANILHIIKGGPKKARKKGKKVEQNIDTN